MVFPVGPFKDSYNLNSFGGPGRNAYKGIALLQKPGTHQSDPYKMEPYKTFCRGHMIPAFVDKMVSPIEKVGKSRKHCVFPMVCGSGGSKRRRVEPSGQMRDEKLLAVVARSAF